MITKITKLKKFGIFHNFSWKTELPEFKKFNLIYGWNRSGKTTVSRIFASCERKCVYDEKLFKRYPENGEFEIKTDNGDIIKSDNILINTLPIKVFNQDFIEENISFDPSNSCNPIVYISEEDIKSKEHLKQLKSDKITHEGNLSKARKNKEAKEDMKNSFLTGLGREIANAIFDKSYNKTNVENKINSIGIDNFIGKKLSDEDKKKYEAISKSEKGKNQNKFSEYQFKFSFNEESITSFEKIFASVKRLLNKKVVSETLGRLKDDQTLNNWVKQGFDLYKEKEEKENCLFCQKQLEKDFLISLSKHFSKDYEDLLKNIIFLKSELAKIKINKDTLYLYTTEKELYPDLKDSFSAQSKSLEDKLKKTNSWIDNAIAKLDEKYNNALIIIANPDKPDNFVDSYNQTIDELNKIILKHNAKVKNHTVEVKSAGEKLELHSIAIALSKQNYKNIIDNLEKAISKEKTFFEVLNKNGSDISELEKKTSNIGKAIKKINKHLSDFFGKDEITLDLDASKKGYILERNGEPAKNLSEGEKTAIAFSYFIVKIGEKEFKIKDAIIFIDDPISSFDSNFIYHSFSLIQNHFKEVGQLFISTHNFRFFNLAKYWFINKNNHIKKDNEKLRKNGKNEKLIPCEFYMIENFFDKDIRKAKIVELDKTLRNYKSEYHFLFSRLDAFKDVNLSYADFYTIGNIARRFFDIFADFKIPDVRDQKQKMEAIVKQINSESEKISAVDCGRAYKLVNEFSHNSDPISTIEHKDKSESKEAIKILLKIVEESDVNHYRILEKSLT